MTGYVYEITGEKLNGSYIGSTISFRQRKYSHLKNLDKGIHAAKGLQEYYRTNGKDSIQFNILFQEEDISRKQLFEIEQVFIDKYSLQERLLNASEKVTIPKNADLDKGKRLGDYNDYLSLRLAFEFDGFYYHVGESLEIGRDRLSLAIQEESYLSHAVRYSKNEGSLTQLQKYQLYKKDIQKFLPHVTNQGGLTFYQYLQLWAYDYFGVSRVDVSAIFDIGTETLGSNIYGKSKTQISIRSKEFFDRLPFSEKLELVSNCPIQLTKNPRGAQSLFFLIDVINKKEEGLMVKDIGELYGINRTVISAYANLGRINQALKDKYNSLSDQDIEIAKIAIRRNQLLLPLVKNPSIKLEGCKMLIRTEG